MNETWFPLKYLTSQVDIPAMDKLNINQEIFAQWELTKPSTVFIFSH